MTFIHSLWVCESFREQPVQGQVETSQTVIEPKPIGEVSPFLQLYNNAPRSPIPTITTICPHQEVPNLIHYPNRSLSWANSFEEFPIHVLKSWNITAFRNHSRLGIGEFEVFNIQRAYSVLSIQFRPINPVTGERIAPQALYERALSNKGSNPLCLCPLRDVDLSHNLGRGASIAQALSGMYNGEYIFECSSRKCGYVGKSFLYSKNMLDSSLNVSSH